MKYMYIGKTVLDNLYFCVCFMCSVGVQQWADAILTAILGPYLTCMNKHKFIINSKTTSPFDLSSYMCLQNRDVETSHSSHRYSDSLPSVGPN